MINISKEEEKFTITIKEDIGIENAKELKDALYEAVINFDETTVNFKKNIDFHLSIIQLLLSAKMESEKLNKIFKIIYKNDVLENSLNSLGICSSDLIQ